MKRCKHSVLEVEQLESRDLLNNRIFLVMVAGLNQQGPNIGLEQLRQSILANNQLSHVVPRVFDWQRISSGLPVTPDQQVAATRVFAENLLREQGADTQDRIYMGGHSAGGWVALQVAANINGRLADGGITIDPINPNRWNPNQKNDVHLLPPGISIERWLNFTQKHPNFFLNLGQYGFEIERQSNYQDWVGIYPTNASAIRYENWIYTNGEATGNGSLASTKPGQHELRMYKHNRYSQLVAVSQPFMVNPVEGRYSLTVDTREITVNTPMKANFTTPSNSNNAQDWVGIYRVGASASPAERWAYTNGGNSGSVSLSPSTTGPHEWRYYKNNGYTWVAVSQPFMVNPVEGRYSLTANANAVTVNIPMNFSFTTPPPSGSERYSRDLNGQWATHFTIDSNKSAAGGEIGIYKNIHDFLLKQLNRVLNRASNVVADEDMSKLSMAISYRITFNNHEVNISFRVPRLTVRSNLIQNERADSRDINSTSERHKAFCNQPSDCLNDGFDRTSFLSELDRYFDLYGDGKVDLIDYMLFLL